MTVFSCPSKVIFFGEYAILEGAAGVVIGTKPNFELEVAAIGPQKFKSPFHPDSPAGQLISKHFSSLSETEWTWRDPFLGGGGFGGSTAEYLLCYRALQHLQLESASTDLWELRERFLSHFSDGRPSGYDLLAQAFGGICSINAEEKIIKNVGWPFADHCLWIAKSKTKIKTHEHLATLDRKKLKPMTQLSAKLSTYFQGARNEPQPFLEDLKLWRQELQRLDLIHPQTLLSQKVFASENLFLKGCGALGADVVAVFAESGCDQLVKELFFKNNLHYVATVGPSVRRDKKDKKDKR